MKLQLGSAVLGDNRTSNAWRGTLATVQTSFMQYDVKCGGLAPSGLAGSWYPKAAVVGDLVHPRSNW